VIDKFKDLSTTHSRKKWHNVTHHLLKGDHDKASEEKLKVEEFERQLRKKREEEKVKWVPSLFEHKDGEWYFKDSNLEKLRVKDDEKSSWSFW